MNVSSFSLCVGVIAPCKDAITFYADRAHREHSDQKVNEPAGCLTSGKASALSLAGVYQHGVVFSTWAVRLHRVSIRLRGSSWPGTDDCERIRPRIHAQSA